MTNVESMDYTHSHPSTIASLSSIAHCPLSPRELVQTSSVHPNPVIQYALSHISLIIFFLKIAHTYLAWHFHSHSEIYCHATSIIIIYMTWAFMVILLCIQFELSYTYSSSASVAWQFLLLALTSIDGHLHSPLISLIDVRLSPFFSSSHITPTIIP